VKHRRFLPFRWHKRVQLDIHLGGGFLSLGWVWRYQHRPVCYWSPDATPMHEGARGLFMRAATD
jgi:hypothetical protein